MSVLVKALNWPGFLLFFVREVMVSNLRVAVDVLTPQDRSDPAIVAVYVGELTGPQLFLLTTIISMTPGTLSLDVSEPDCLIYVHAMYLTDRDGFVTDLQERYIKWVRRVL